MKNNTSLAIFETHKIRRNFNKETETWYFSVIDIVAVLIEQHDLQPRDALHLATMQSQKVSIIISEDKDFDKVPGIERRSLLSLAI